MQLYKPCGAASELKEAYHNYQKQIKSKEVLNWRETCHSHEIQILRKAFVLQPKIIFPKNNVNLHTFSVKSTYIHTPLEIE